MGVPIHHRFDPATTPPECRTVVLFASPPEGEQYSECMLCRARFGLLEWEGNEDILTTCPRCKTTSEEYWALMQEKRL